YLSIGDDYGGVRIVRGEQSLRLFIFDLCKLVKRQSMCLRKFLDRRGTQFVMTAYGLVRLCPSGNDFVTIGEQSPQRRHGGFRRSHEDNAHGSTVYYDRR